VYLIKNQTTTFSVHLFECELKMGDAGKSTKCTKHTCKNSHRVSFSTVIYILFSTDNDVAPNWVHCESNSGYIMSQILGTLWVKFWVFTKGCT